MGADASVELLKIEQVAGLLNVSRRTVYRLVDGGKIPPPIRIGRRMLRWVAATIRDWMAKGCPVANKTR